MFYNGFLCWALTFCKKALHGSMGSVNVKSINVLFHSIEYRGVNEHFALLSCSTKKATLTRLFTAMNTTLIGSKNMH